MKSKRKRIKKPVFSSTWIEYIPVLMKEKKKPEVKPLFAN